MTIYCCAGPMQNFHCDACGRDASPGERLMEVQSQKITKASMSDDEWNAYAEAAGFDDKPRLSIIDTHDLIKKMAEATFEQFGEGGGHDMGLWLDSGEINEDQYRYLEGL